ncbi:MAG: sulfite exporter TauE/SafE family protein [Verrucomicrobiota bacterium]
MSLEAYAFAALAIFLVGASKAGFGGGAGILATPSLALVLDPATAIGALLPLLILTDFVSLYLYRGGWAWSPILRIMPGCVVGVIAGSCFIGSVPEKWMYLLLGTICISFCGLFWWRGSKKVNPVKAHNWFHALLIGLTMGLSSTLAHAAGPIFSMYLIPMKLSPKLFVGTTVLAFTILNLIKVPGYVSLSVIDSETLFLSLLLSPWVPIGALAGFHLNKRLSASRFTLIIYLIIFMTGCYLIGKTVL